MLITKVDIGEVLLVWHATGLVVSSCEIEERGEERTLTQRRESFNKNFC